MTESFSFDIFSGDQDSVIPLTGSRTLVHGLAEELGLKTTVPYRVWFEGKQVNFNAKLFKVEEEVAHFSISKIKRCFSMSLLFRLVGGLKFMVIYSLLPPLEERHMKLHSRSLKDHLCCSVRF